MPARTPPSGKSPNAALTTTGAEGERLVAAESPKTEYFFEDLRPKGQQFPDAVKSFFVDADTAKIMEGVQEGDGVKVIQKYYFMGLPWLIESWDFRGQKRVYKFLGMDPFWPLIIFSFGTLWSKLLLAILICVFIYCTAVYSFKTQTPLSLGDESDSDTSSDDSGYEDYEDEEGAEHLSMSKDAQHGDEFGNGKLEAYEVESRNGKAAEIQDEMMEIFAF